MTPPTSSPPRGRLISPSLVRLSDQGAVDMRMAFFSYLCIEKAELLPIKFMDAFALDGSVVCLHFRQQSCQATLGEYCKSETL